MRPEQMKQPHELSLFIFRRDLRLDDNTALINALASSKKVIPCFIFDPRQVNDSNRYKSAHCLQFMIESLKELEHEITRHNGVLYLFHGVAEVVVEKLLLKLPIDALFFNNDYTPFSTMRDNAIKKACADLERACITFDDLTLVPPHSFFNKQKKPYQIFTPFFNAAKKIAVQSPKKFTKPRTSALFTDPIKLPSIDLSRELTRRGKILTTKNELLAVHGGRSKGLQILHEIGDFKNYSSTHDIPEISTTHLSAYLKFGAISAREAYYAISNKLGAHHPLIRQLYWRDFFTYIAYHFPRVFGHAFREKYDRSSWSTNRAHFDRWCAGNTGFPIIDAGMRQLNATGFMHNRVRMIVASFLAKDLQIDWRKGERYFAQQLVDYDPAVNNGNWQWCASTGADAQPYFRTFNPWLQQKKFDPECVYVKTWVPELRAHSARQIHGLHKTSVDGYPAPMIEREKKKRDQPAQHDY